MRRRSAEGSAEGGEALLLAACRRRDPEMSGRVDTYQLSAALQECRLKPDVSELVRHSTADGRIEYGAWLAARGGGGDRPAAASVAVPPPASGGGRAVDALLEQQRAELAHERATVTGNQLREDEHRVEEQIAQSVANLEEQLQSVQREAAEVLGLCDTTAAFTNEVRDGLRSARVSMGEQRGAMDCVLLSVTERLRAANAAASTTQQLAPPSGARPPEWEEADATAAADRIEYLEGEVGTLRAERDALSAHIRVNDSDLASGDAKKAWKIQWLTQKLENVEIAGTDRQRAMEEEMALVRARHRDGLLRIRQLEEQLNRAEVTTASRRGRGGYSDRPSGGGGGRESRRSVDPHQGKLQRDLDALLSKVEQLTRDVANDAAADSRLVEETERERRTLLEDLLDVEQAVKEKRRNADKENQRRRSGNGKLRYVRKQSPPQLDCQGCVMLHFVRGTGRVGLPLIILSHRVLMQG